MPPLLTADSLTQTLAGMEARAAGDARSGAPRRGPAAAACAAAERAFAEGASRRGDGASLAELASSAPDIRGFALEGAGFADVYAARGLDAAAGNLPAFVHVFVAVGRGMGLALRGDGAPGGDGTLGVGGPSSEDERDGYGFGLTLLRPGRVLPADPHVDRGCGRALWYTQAGAVPRIRAAIGSMEAERRAAVWRGVGVAAVYTGPADGLDALRRAAGTYTPELEEGAALGHLLRRATGRT